MTQDEDWMSHALKMARRAYELDEVPVGAVIVDFEGLIAEGYNAPISRRCATAHAEITAIEAACEKLGNYRLPGTTLYVTIEPCTMCVGAIIHARIDRVVFGALEPKAGALDSHPLHPEGGVFNHEFVFKGGVLEQACSELMQDFFQERRAKKKALKKSLLKKA